MNQPIMFDFAAMAAAASALGITSLRCKGPIETLRALAEQRGAERTLFVYAPEIPADEWKVIETVTFVDPDDVVIEVQTTRSATLLEIKAERRRPNTNHARVVDPIGDQR